MEKKPGFNPDDVDESYAFDIQNEFHGVVSATECTGLMPTPPLSDDEAEAYNEIYVVPKTPNETEKALRSEEPRKKS